jgi:Na+/H+-dicarboxylate symporter
MQLIQFIDAFPGVYVATTAVKNRAITQWLALAAMLGGVVVGQILGPRAEVFSPLAKWIIELIKWIAIPLLFFAITDSLVRLDLELRSVVSLAFAAITNSSCAVAIGLILSNVLQAGRFFSEIATGQAAVSPVDLLKRVNAIATLDWHGFLTTPIPLAIAAAIMTGVTIAGMSRITGQRALEGRFLSASRLALALLFRVMEVVVYLIPLAVFAGVAKAVGKHGIGAFQQLAIYAIVMIGGMALHVMVTYQSWIVFGLRRGLREFWQIVKEPCIYAFGINSSLATLPVTLRSLEKLGIREGPARLSACIGTNFNNDGIVLYEVMAVLFLVQAFGIELSLLQQLGIAALCVVATVGIAGVPEAGIVTLTVVLGVLEIPTAVLPVLLSVDWLVGRCRSVTNVLGDIAVAAAIQTMTLGREKTDYAHRSSA